MDGTGAAGGGWGSPGQCPGVCCGTKEAVSESPDKLHILALVTCLPHSCFLTTATIRMVFRGQVTCSGLPSLYIFVPELKSRPFDSSVYIAGSGSFFWLSSGPVTMWQVSSVVGPGPQFLLFHQAGSG